MKRILFIVFLVIIQFSFGQVKDSTKIVPDFRINRLHQTKISNNIRVGLGIQKSFVTEIGYSRMKMITSCTGFFSKSYYSSIEYVPKTPNYKDVFGIKIGLEYNLSIITVGLETKYQTDFNNKDVVITPKIGLGFGYINLFYGYNISTNKNPFPSFSNHQFSLVFNIPITSKDISK
jgi:hypothetical protein